MTSGGSARVRRDRPPACVGALVRDDRHRVFVHRRAPDRRLFPGWWDVVGGHLEPGETPEEALARELAEETGWTLARVECVLADWEWEADGVVRRELDYLVEVHGDLDDPRLEAGKHDAFAWVGLDRLDLLLEGRSDVDQRLRDVVAKAVRTRLTKRLRLEPIGAEHAADLWRLHQEDGVARWHGGPWSVEDAQHAAAGVGAAWESDGVGKWIAYDRGTGALVGRGGLSRMASTQPLTRQIQSLLHGAWAQRLEIGWTVREELWGRGYATEIGRAGLAFARDELGTEQVVAFTERHNVASRAVMERLAMVEIGEVVGPGLVAGRSGVHDDALFAVYATAGTR